MYTIRLDNEDHRITADDVQLFCRLYIDGLPMRDRISDLLVLDMLVYLRFHGVNPHMIVEEIRCLETDPSASHTKPATEFRRPPLRGLWHKHFFSARFLPMNIYNGLAGGRLEQIINEEMTQNPSTIVTQEMIEAISRRVTNEPFEQRFDDSRLTGEWIVFASHDGQNYYLCLNTHGAGDQFIANRLQNHCRREFPQLDYWNDS